MAQRFAECEPRVVAVVRISRQHFHVLQYHALVAVQRAQKDAARPAREHEVPQQSHIAERLDDRAIAWSIQSQRMRRRVASSGFKNGVRRNVVSKCSYTPSKGESS